MTRSGIVAGWKPGAFDGFRCGVSLHSHTSHSRETLDFILRLAATCPPAAAILRQHDFEDVWWTPPLGPREALLLERGQI
jgi:hypothetical protein